MNATKVLIIAGLGTNLSGADRMFKIIYMVIP